MHRLGEVGIRAGYLGYHGCIGNEYVGEPVNPGARVHHVSVFGRKPHPSGSDGMAIVRHVGGNETSEPFAGGEASRAPLDRPGEGLLSRQSVNKPNSLNERPKIVVIGIIKKAKFDHPESLRDRGPSGGCGRGSAR